MTSHVSEFARVEVGVAVAREFGLHEQWHEKTIVDCQRIISAILIRTQWPRKKWQITIDKAPNLNDKTCAATLALGEDNVSVEIQVMVSPLNNGKRRLVLFGDKLYTDGSGNSDVEISDPATLVDIVDNTVNQLYELFVEKAREHPSRPQRA